MPSSIKNETIQFLKDLKQNNNREWLAANKERYLSANVNFIDFIQSLIEAMSLFDKSVVGLEAKKCVFRIYRDVRFSNDKTPYKPHFSAILGKDKGLSLAGYYIHLEPEHTILAGGVYKTEPVHLKAIRKEISYNGPAFLKIINDKNFKKTFKLEGERLVKVPQGFEKDDPMGEYLKYKQLTVIHSVSAKEINTPGFTKYCAAIFKGMVPFNKFLNEPVLELM
jgi:uncharacterized protein (TIGR02453 family)